MQGMGVRPVTVPATAAPASVTVYTAPCRLAGWSLAASLAAGAITDGSVTSPGAATQVAGFGTLPAGQYTLNWTVELSGTPSATDLNNFEVTQAAVPIAVSVNEGAVGVYGQPAIQIVIPAGGATLAIKSIAAGTAGAVYSATATLTSADGAECVIYDSGQILGISSMGPEASDTKTFLGHSVYVSTNVKITVLSGTVSGVIYVSDFDSEDDAKRRE